MPPLIYTKQILEVVIWSRLQVLIYFLDKIELHFIIAPCATSINSIYDTIFN